MASTTDSQIAFDQVAQHNQTDDCWIIVHSKVWDVSEFLAEHPGGADIILKFAGADATDAYDEIHAPSIIDRTLSSNDCKGVIDSTTLPPEPQKQTAEIDSSPALPGVQASQTGPVKPERKPLTSLISVHDFEEAAAASYSEKAWAFYSSAATDLVSHNFNLQCHRQLMLRPRVLRNVSETSIKRKILGHACSAPFFVSPTAMARLAHPEGELAVAGGCGKEDIVQIISSNASYPLADIVGAGRPGQTFFLQLYVNSERQKTEALLREAKSLGIKAIFVTVDAPIPGKREADERIAAANNLSAAVSGAVATNDKKGGGLGRVMAKYIDPTLEWSDLPWLRRASGDLPIVLKGVQTAADAKRAAELGVEAILLSNHGGRSLDTCQPAMLTLLELHRYFPEVFDKMEIYVDGGFSRGTDILKALALGATAVGLGRPYLYALSYGQDGVEHMTDILKDELISSMKLSGITDIDQAHPGMVNTARLEPLLCGEVDHAWIKWKPKACL